METNMVVAPVLFASFCFIIPAILLGLFLWSSGLRSSRAIGAIVGYESTSNGDMSAPIIEFQTPDGRKFTFKGMYSNTMILDIVSAVFSKYILKKDPSQINVLYDPKDPQKARINSIGNIYIVPIVLFSFGACMLLYAIPMTRGVFTQIINIMDRLSNIF